MTPDSLPYPVLAVEGGGGDQGATANEVIGSERWLPISGYEDAYEVSDTGKVRNARTKLTLKPYVQRGYLHVGLYGNGRRITPSVHATVLSAFCGPREPGMVGAHLDGQPTNNNLANLAWVTPAENERHKLAHGTDKRGVKSHHAKFTDLQVAVIREMHLAGISIEKIAVLASVSNQCINDIVRGITYNDK